ncbi:MAG: TIGR04076 family protein [Deltaproteobacteria bacterium]|nr:TIGR04076 family protein [Deltaproteobacteria bacterium]
MEMWKSNPKNLKIAEVFPECQTYRIVAEVIKSQGCGAGHNVGDKFIFSGDGCFVTKEPPGKVCLAALQPLIGRLDTLVLDSLLDGKEPRGLVWDTVHCVDVGVENGGWGEIIMKVKVEKI